MDIRRLRAFVTVAERRTVSRAAEVLRITQPALSRQIGALEQEFGFKLFERAGRRILLTARGEQLLGDCRNLLVQAGALDERVQMLCGSEIRRLRVAASPTTIEGVFPSFLRRYAQRFPDVKLMAIEADAAAQPGLLESGEVQFSINVVNVVNVDDTRFGNWLLPRFHMVAASAPSLAIGSAGEIDICKLVEHPLLLLKPHFATRNLFDAACRTAGVRPDVAFEGGSAHGLLALAEAGHGVAVVPPLLPIDRRALRVMRVTHRQAALEIAPAVQWVRRRMPLCHAEAFCELLTAHLGEHFADMLVASNAKRGPYVTSRIGGQGILLADRR